MQLTARAVPSTELIAVVALLTPLHGALSRRASWCARRRAADWPARALKRPRIKREATQELIVPGGEDQATEAE